MQARALPCPLQKLIDGRLHYVAAALTIVRAYIAAGRPDVAGPTWPAHARQAIYWIASLVADEKAQGRGECLPDLADPVAGGRA